MRSRGLVEPTRNHLSRNRSDEVRTRRSQRSQQRASSAATRIASPVVMRGIVHGKAEPIYRQAARSNPRRTFYVAMDSTRATGVAGAELRLPAIRLVNPGWRAISVMIALAMVFAIFSIYNSPFFRVNTISIQGLQRLSASDLESIIHLQNLSIIEVRPEQVKEEIALAFPELADVQVTVELPNFVTITARERQPVLAWQKDGATYWVDPEGYIFPVRGEGGGPLVTIETDDEIPMVYMEAAAAGQGEEEKTTQSKEQPGVKALLASMGYSTPAYLNRRADMKILNASLQLVKMLPEGTQIIYDKNNGLGWNDAGGWQVYVGKDLHNFEAKMGTYQTILADLESKGIRPELISVEHLNAPFFRGGAMAREASDEY